MSQTVTTLSQLPYPKLINGYAPDEAEWRYTCGQRALWDNAYWENSPYPLPRAEFQRMLANTIGWASR